MKTTYHGDYRAYTGGLGRRATMSGMAGMPPESPPGSTQSSFGASFSAIAEALERAGAGHESGSDLMRALIDLEDEIDVASATVVMECLIGLVAVKTGKTPSAVIATEAASVPPDDYWNPTATPLSPGARVSWRTRMRRRITREVESHGA